MKMIALALLTTGCLAGRMDANGRPSVGHNMRPAVQPKLSELPVDAGKRDAILDQAYTTPGPETPRQQLKGRARQVETGAAWLAAILGAAASTTSNVTLGFAMTTDDEDAPPVTHAAPAAPLNPDHAPLVPWVPLR